MPQLRLPPSVLKVISDRSLPTALKPGSAPGRAWSVTYKPIPTQSSVPTEANSGLAATIGSVDHSPAYVIDLTPNGETRYDASFAFNSHGASSPDGPIDIFVGLDQNAQPTFGVQFQTDTLWRQPDPRLG